MVQGETGKVPFAQMQKADRFLEDIISLVFNKSIQKLANILYSFYVEMFQRQDGLLITMNL